MKAFLYNLLTLRYIPCHRRPERSWLIKGWQFPVCMRCMAILLGYFFVIPMFFLVDTSSIIIKLLVACLLTLPMLVDGFTQLKGKRFSTNKLRFWTGLSCGIGQSLFIVVIAKVLIDTIFHAI